MGIEYEIPVKTVSEANRRGCWQKHERRRKGHRGLADFTTYIMWVAGAENQPSQPWLITLTRVSPRKLDSDNLAGSMKAIRDGIADALGINDGDDSAAIWKYEQEKGKPPSVKVRIEEQPT